MVGIYNPQYSTLFTSSPTYGMGKSKRKSPFEVVHNTSTSLTLSEFYPKIKIKGNICFKKQSGHVLSTQCDPNEDRFKLINFFPKVFAKYKNGQLVKFSKQGLRRSIFEKSDSNGIMRDVKIQEKSKGILDIGKMTKRKELFKVINTPEITSEKELDKYYSKLKKVKSIPEFSKSLSVEGKLPRYLQVN